MTVFKPFFMLFCVYKCVPIWTHPLPPSSNDDKNESAKDDPSARKIMFYPVPFVVPASKVDDVLHKNPEELQHMIAEKYETPYMPSNLPDSVIKKINDILKHPVMMELDLKKDTNLDFLNDPLLFEDDLLSVTTEPEESLTYFTDELSDIRSSTVSQEMKAPSKQPNQGTMKPPVKLLRKLLRDYLPVVNSENQLTPSEKNSVISSLASKKLRTAPSMKYPVSGNGQFFSLLNTLNVILNRNSLPPSKTYESFKVPTYNVSFPKFTVNVSENMLEPQVLLYNRATTLNTETSSATHPDEPEIKYTTYPLQVETDLPYNSKSTVVSFTFTNKPVVVTNTSPLFSFLDHESATKTDVIDEYSPEEESPTNEFQENERISLLHVPNTRFASTQHPHFQDKTRPSVSEESYIEHLNHESATEFDESEHPFIHVTEKTVPHGHDPTKELASITDSTLTVDVTTYTDSEQYPTSSFIPETQETTSFLHFESPASTHDLDISESVGNNYESPASTVTTENSSYPLLSEEETTTFYDSGYHSEDEGSASTMTHPVNKVIYESVMYSTLTPAMITEESLSYESTQYSDESMVPEMSDLENDLQTSETDAINQSVSDESETSFITSDQQLQTSVFEGKSSTSQRFDHTVINEATDTTHEPRFTYVSESVSKTTHYPEYNLAHQDATSSMPHSEHTYFGEIITKPVQTFEHNTDDYTTHEIDPEQSVTHDDAINSLPYSEHIHSDDTVSESVQNDEHTFDEHTTTDESANFEHSKNIKKITMFEISTAVTDLITNDRSVTDESHLSTVTTEHLLYAPEIEEAALTEEHGTIFESTTDSTHEFGYSIYSESPAYTYTESEDTFVYESEANSTPPPVKIIFTESATDSTNLPKDTSVQGSSPDTQSSFIESTPFSDYSILFETSSSVTDYISVESKMDEQTKNEKSRTPTINTKHHSHTQVFKDSTYSAQTPGNTLDFDDEGKITKHINDNSVYKDVTSTQHTKHTIINKVDVIDSSNAHDSTPQLDEIILETSTRVNDLTSQTSIGEFSTPSVTAEPPKHNLAPKDAKGHFSERTVIYSDALTTTQLDKLSSIQEITTEEYSPLATQFIDDSVLFGTTTYVNDLTSRESTVNDSEADKFLSSMVTDEPAATQHLKGDTRVTRRLEFEGATATNPSEYVTLLEPTTNSPHNPVYIPAGPVTATKKYYGPTFTSLSDTTTDSYGFETTFKTALFEDKTVFSTTISDALISHKNKFDEHQTTVNSADAYVHHPTDFYDKNEIDLTWNKPTEVGYLSNENEGVVETIISVPNSQREGLISTSETYSNTVYDILESATDSSTILNGNDRTYQVTEGESSSLFLGDESVNDTTGEESAVHSTPFLPTNSTNPADNFTITQTTEVPFSDVEEEEVDSLFDCTTQSMMDTSTEKVTSSQPKETGSVLEVGPVEILDTTNSVVSIIEDRNQTTEKNIGFSQESLAQDVGTIPENVDSSTILTNTFESVTTKISRIEKTNELDRLLKETKIPEDFIQKLNLSMKNFENDSEESEDVHVSGTALVRSKAKAEKLLNLLSGELFIEGADIEENDEDNDFEVDASGMKIMKSGQRKGKWIENLTNEELMTLIDSIKSKHFKS